MTVLLTEALKWVGKLRDGPDVVKMLSEIAQVFPDLRPYCNLGGPSTAWCGIFQMWLLSKFKIRGPHADNGVGGFMYVDSWVKVPWGGMRVDKSQARPGDLLCLKVPHHITMIVRVLSGDRAECVGGNQSDGVTIGIYSISDDRVMGIIRPPEPNSVGVNPGTGTQLRPLIKVGDVGAAVSELQELLGVHVDGEFGPDTNAAVRRFQASRGLLVDGEVGDDTWAALMEPGSKLPATTSSVPHAAEYVRLWSTMTITDEAEVTRIATDRLRNKVRYAAAVAGTRVPWYFLLVIHNRESTSNFSKNIHNGQPLSQVTTIAPKGRGPFSSFEESVQDWIRLKGLDKVASWPLEQIAYQSERNNGPGYRNHGVPSAYLWALSSAYKGGKYIKDGLEGWSPTTWDTQCGTMTLLKKLMELDKTIVLDGAKPPLDGEVIGPDDPDLPPDVRPELDFIARVFEFLERSNMANLSTLFAVIKNPVVRKLLTGGAVTLEELLSLPVSIRSVIVAGKDGDAAKLPPPEVDGPPPIAKEEKVDVRPVVVEKPPVVDKGGLTISAIIAALIGGGVAGTPFGMGEAPTTTGTLLTIAGAVLPFLSPSTAIVKIGTGILEGLAGWAQKRTTKT